MGRKGQDSAVLFTLFYPYSTFDYYVDVEVEMICKQFNKVYIIPISVEDKVERIIPSNAKLIESKFTPKASNSIVRAMLSPTYRKEILLAIKRGKLNKNLFKHLTLQHSKVLFLRDLMLNILKHDGGVSLVYSHWLLEGTYAAALIKDSYSFKLVSKAHSLDIYKERHVNNYIPFLENTVKQLDQLHFISELGKSYFNSHYEFKMPEYKQFVSRLGTANPLPPKEYLTTDTLKIISVSYIYPLKRVDLILEAIAQIDNFKIEWHHIGAYYENHTQKLKEKAAELLSSKSNVKVEWLGNCSIPQVYAHYQNNHFDLFISASSSEGIPVSMMECMSFGIPVLSTDVGGVKEIVDHGVNGIIVDANPTAQDIANEIKAYFALSQEQKTSMRHSAYYKWKNFYNAEINFQKFLDIALNEKEHKA